ncbi:MAG: Bifunctional folate synthesis protein [Anaerolineales bacterium]|nr:Bifunctional folate synthesis protein [Anaerolineales bacterium]
MTHDIFIALGTNLGDRPANLTNALASLPPDFERVRSSRIYETPPWGHTDQPAFLNMALHARTDLGPSESLARLKQIEVEMGREQTFRWGPRLIDLDILFYDDLVIDSPPLAVPHPRLHERAFVLVPLMDVAPDLTHPVLGQSIRQLLTAVDPSGITLFADKNQTTVTPKS